MRVVVQRVTEAAVTVAGEEVARIRQGLVVLVGVSPHDGPDEAEVLAAKLAGLRIFSDQQGKMNLSVVEAGGAVLVVSQFTLYADARRGRRPSFTDAAPPAVAEPIVEQLVGGLRRREIRVVEGRFGAKMEVRLVNDGPVTLVLEARQGRIV